MQRCYRTPGPILTAAHAIGMGLLRDEGMLRGLTTRKIGKESVMKYCKVALDPVKKLCYIAQKNSPNLIPINGR